MSYVKQSCYISECEVHGLLKCTESRKLADIDMYKTSIVFTIGAPDIKNYMYTIIHWIEMH